MAVPNTDTFTLQDVVDEINPTTNDLVDCFADAVSTEFDPTYSSTKDELVHFRNYGGRIAFLMGTGYLDAGTACGNSFLNENYHDGTGSEPKNGDTVYTTHTGASALVGSDLYYPISGFTIQIDNFGVISNKTSCTPP